MELSAKLPADPQRGQPLPSLVVATLDVNIGRNLPAEELQVGGEQIRLAMGSCVVGMQGHMDMCLAC